MIDCLRGEIRDLLPDLMHGALDERHRAMVEAHVAGCAACTAELALLRSSQSVMLRSTPAVNAERIARAVRLALDGAGSAGRRSLRRRPLVPMWALSAAAALLIVVIGALAMMNLSGGARSDVAQVATDVAVESPPDLPGATSLRPELAWASASGLLVGAVADLDEDELASMLQYLPALDPYPEEDPPVLVPAFNGGEG